MRIIFTPDHEKSLAAVDPSIYYIVKGGKNVYDVASIEYGSIIEIVARARGGKGGFGALLKSFRICRSSNIDMSRDLTGRRMRDVNEEKRLKEWVDKRAEREKEKERKTKEKYEKLKRGKGKHDFADPDYEQQSSSILDKTEDALEAGLAASPSQSPPSASPEIESDDSDVEAYLPEILAGGMNNLKPKRKMLPPVVAPPEKKMCRESQWQQDKVHIEQPGGDHFYKPPKIIDSMDLVKDQAIEEEQKTEEAPPKKKEKTITTVVNVEDYEAIVIKDLKDISELTALSNDHLKAECMRHGLKCGGSGEERANRLWSIKGLKPKKYPKNILAKK